MHDPATPEADIRQRILTGLSHGFSVEQNFPTCLDAAMLIRDTLKDPETTDERAAQAVSLEPLIAAKLIRLANSVAFNAGRPPVSEVRTAIGRLGFELVRTLSLAVALDQMLKGNLCAAYAPYAQQAWERAIQTAAIARVLARRIGRINPDEALLAGIVSQIGVFYLLYRCNDEPACRADNRVLFSLLRHDHRDVAERLLAALEIPEHIQAALAPPPLEPPPGAPNSLNDLVLIAGLLADVVCSWESPPEEELRQRAEDRKQYADLIADAEEDILQTYLSLND